MNKLKKVFALVLVCVMLAVGAVIPANAATYTAAPNTTVETVFTVNDVFGVQGGFYFDNLDMFSSIAVTKRVLTEEASLSGAYNCTNETVDLFKNGSAAFTNPTTSISGYTGAVLGCFFFGAQNAVDIELVLTCTLKADLDPSDICNVTFKHENVINADGDMGSMVTDSNTIQLATADDLIIGTQKRYEGDNREIRLVVKMTRPYQEILELEKITVYLNIDGVTSEVDLDGVYQKIENDGVYVSASEYDCTRFALCYIGKIKDVNSITAYASKTDSEGNVVFGATKKLDLEKLRK